VAVTHDPLVEEYADRVVELTDGVLVGGVPDGDGSVDACSDEACSDGSDPDGDDPDRDETPDETLDEPHRSTEAATTGDG